MKRIFKHSDNLKPMVSLYPSVDRRGDVFILVRYQDDDGSYRSVAFKHIDSAIDFVATNFNATRINSRNNNLDL